ncbi:MAG: formylglycine-generating enzyme family protein, partial [Planctomycetota bacterium]|nr:formylglycine-generating enzyme family protein [Planctomycetota bacterium]
RMLAEAETLKARQEMRDAAVAEAKRLFQEGKHAEAAAAFQKALAVPGYERDAEALTGLRRARGISRKAEYEAALAAAEEAYAKAKGGNDKQMWQSVKAAARKALACGYPEDQRARDLLAEAEKIVPQPVYGEWPFTAESAKQRQRETAESWGLDITWEVALPGQSAMRLALVPPGEFARATASGNRKRLRLTRPFYLGITEVTRGQFHAFVEATAYQTDAEKQGGAFTLASGKWNKDPKVNWRALPFAQSDDQPAVCISWNDAQAFCAWLNTLEQARPEGMVYRLPTEAEWEYACRCGSDATYASGDGEAALAAVGWYWNNAKPRQTQPVAKLAANAWGLHDLHGNVWEWCLDKFSKTYLDDCAADNPYNNRDGSKRVLRGGSWATAADRCAASVRDADYAGGRLATDTGFRVALAPALE